MCFSATASFSAAIVIGGVGIGSLSLCKEPKQRYLGAVPLLFALQQLAEGFVWLGFSQSSFLPHQHFFSLCFLFFAWVVWPILIPIAFYKIEPNPARKKWQKRLIYVGILSAAYSMFNMIAKHPDPSIATFHIIYITQKLYNHQLFFIPHQSIYFMATVLPMFLSSLRGVKVLAIANFVAVLFCFFLFQYALPSTWCFFAAFLSSIICWILWKNNQHLRSESPTN